MTGKLPKCPLPLVAKRGGRCKKHEKLQPAVAISCVSVKQAH